jgi:Caspase domain/Carbohydrate binding domain
VSATPAGRHALIVATASYSDTRLQQLRAPAADAEALADVLRDPEKGDFEVKLGVNETHGDLTRMIARFFGNRSPRDLLLLHFSCHGVKDEDGELYLAATDTDLDLLSATGISAAWLNDRINRTRSRRTVVLLDCCFSGSFPSGLRRRGDGMDAPQRLEGRGRAIVTASNAMEYAYEGDELKGEGHPSIFTEAVVEGLRTGEADLDQDHLVSIDDLYHYVYDQVRDRTPSQTPSIKSDLEGALYLARSTYRPPIEPARLDPDLLARTEDRYAGIREGAVQELAELLTVRDRSVALAAGETLLRMTSDDSRRVAARAQTALEAAEDAVEAERVPTDKETSPALPPVRSAVRSPRRRSISRRVVALGAIIAGLAVAVVVIVVTTGGSSGRGGGATATVNAGGDRGNFVKIPVGNLTTNPSFEHDLSGWETNASRLSRMRVSDAPNGHYVVRVNALHPSGAYAIDDYPDTIAHSIAGRRYVAEAWVRGTEGTDGKRVCLSVREKAGPHQVYFANGGVVMSAADYREVRVAYVAKGTGHPVDVHIFSPSASRSTGDALLADAISITQSSGTGTNTSCG